MLLSEWDFTRSVRGLGPNHIKVDCRRETRGQQAFDGHRSV